MSCAACSARVERAVSKLPDVKSCSVNLLTNSMTVDGSDDESIIAAVRAAGYGASPMGAAIRRETEKDGKSELFAIAARLIASIVLLLGLMYISMGHLMWGFPLPAALADNAIALALIEMLFAIAVMIINQKFYISGTRAILNRSLNMDTLVSIGSLASFFWSVYIVFKMCFAEGAEQHHYLHELYFESAAMIVALITLGKLLEAVAKGKTTNAIKGLLELTPKEAHVIRDGAEITVPTKDVRIGDIFTVRPGESFPVDGEVIKGSSSADEASLSGESIPVEKTVGSAVYAASHNLTGYLECRAVKVGEDTLMGEVVKMVSDAAASKAPIAKLADKVSAVFVPAVLAIAAVTAVVWLLIKPDVGFALARGISVLVISCPCALGLATPVAIMVGSGIGARGGVLFKSAAAMERTGRAKTVAIDKTGTLTGGKPELTDVIPFGIEEKELISLAASLEAKSEHPLAKAIVSYAKDRKIDFAEAESFSALVGSGVAASLGGAELVGGSFSFMSERIANDDNISLHYDRLASEGKTPVFFTRNGSLIGIIALIDSLRHDSREAVDSLRKMGLRVVMITGDNERTARAVAKAAGVDDVRAGVMPSGKADAVRELSKEGGVIMVGDGINDAPALTSADVGIAVGGGTDIAIESADAVLMRSGISGIPSAVKLGRETLKNIKENLFWAFFYNAVGIPIAAGVFSGLGLTMNPMLGAAAMSLSSFFVVMNALRLNTKRIFPKANKNNGVCGDACPLAEEKEGDGKMKIKLNVKGMMCPHCEARVKSVLEAFPEVEEAIVSHKDGTANVICAADLNPEALIKAVNGAGYECSSAE